MENTDSQHIVHENRDHEEAFDDSKESQSSEDSSAIEKCNEGQPSDNVPEVEEILSEEVKEQNHSEALQLKENGNKAFRENNYDQAVSFYTEGIEKCPKTYLKTTAILFSNRAACYVKMEEKEMAITDCTSALEYDAYYTKARLRRAQMYEATEKLDEALKDYNEILTYDKSCTKSREASMRLPQQIQERNEKLKDEMFGKLKELGNMCLKPFGLSTENFKVDQDPNSGGYSINFKQ